MSSQAAVRQRMDAHRCRSTELARVYMNQADIDLVEALDRGNVCMAHAKRLQARYWARRMFSRKEDVFAQYAETVLKMMEDEA